MASTTHAHIVPLAHPLFFILRVVQLVLAVVLLGLLAYLAHVWQGTTTWTTAYSGAIGVGIFTVILTLALGVYYLVTTIAVPKAYNKWAVLALEAAATLFWLVSFALIADCVAALVTLNSWTVDYDYDFSWTRLAKRDTVGPESAVFYAALPFAVIEWLLFVTTLVLFSLGLHKHRRSTTAAGQEATPKQAEAGAAPEFQQQQPVPQVQQPYEQQPMH